MLLQQDANEFLKAMLVKASEHKRSQHWTVVKKSTMPQGTKPIKAIWSFKRKRFSDGTLNKHKARLCAHGGMQQWGINYWETYDPVFSWISVRFLLILLEMLNLDTRTIDFYLAFPKLEIPVYMHLPAGMQFEGISSMTNLISWNLKSLFTVWSKRAPTGMICYKKHSIHEDLRTQQQTHAYFYIVTSLS